MRRLIFHRWCTEATAGIQTNPDREQVSRELFNHIEDHYQALISQGVDPKAAEQQALDAMGDVHELALELAAIHRPLTGKLYIFTKWAMVAFLCMAMVGYGFHFLMTRYVAPAYDKFDSYAVPSLGDNEQQLFSAEPNCFDYSDGYFLSVPRAALWTAEYTDSYGNTKEVFHLNCQLKSFTFIPWAEEPGFARWIWAEDNLGNYYYCRGEDSMASEPSITVKDYHTGMFTYTHDLWLHPYVSQEAQWIELHYDRAGRDIVLHIDLTGGDAS